MKPLKAVLLLSLLTLSPSSWAQDLRGVVVEIVTAGSALDKAGIRPGDIVLSWESSPPSGAASRVFQDLSSPFEWLWLAGEQAPRGPVDLMILRAGQVQTTTLQSGRWQAVVRPRLTRDEEEAAVRARGLSWEGRFEVSAATWNRLADQALAGGRIATATWARVLESETWARAGDPGRSRQVFQKVRGWGTKQAALASLGRTSPCIVSAN